MLKLSAWFFFDINKTAMNEEYNERNEGNRRNISIVLANETMQPGTQTNQAKYL